MTVYVTYISLAIIAIVFLYFLFQTSKIESCRRIVAKVLEGDDLMASLENSKLSAIAEAYKKCITFDVAGQKKTNIPASEFFSEVSVGKVLSLNHRMTDAASGTLVGLGLLGTFLGLTLGVMGFDSSNTENIQKGIQSLLSGMGTAFSTSLAGMTFSLIYTACEKAWKNQLGKAIFDLTEKLDEAHYIDDSALMQSSQQKLFVEFQEKMAKYMEVQTATITSALASHLTYSNEEGKSVVIANVIREILKENEQQSAALKSFSTDLAMQLNDGFDEVLSRQMQQKLIPLMESVDTTTKSVVTHIDQMAETVASPATDMMQSVVDDLKNSMQAVMSEFSNGLSGSATSELENLAHQLGTATQAMADFPKNMENISATLQVTIEEVKHAISEISNTSATANSTAMQQMQEQITFATGSISNAIEQVKEVMSGISQSSQEQSNQMVSKLADAAEKMGSFLTGTISTLSSSVQQSVQDITADVNSKQADLIALQEDTTSQTKKLLESFNTGLDRLEKMNEYVVGTMNGFKQVQGEITLSTSNLRSISGDMKLATELFNKGQNDYAAKLAQLQTSSQHGIDQVTEMLKDSGELSEEYAQKFEVIKQGLGSIFSQLQAGLNEYSRTVKDSTDKYLNQYTSSLTQTTGALASAIERQNEVTEMLTDTITRNKR